MPDDPRPSVIAPALVFAFGTAAAMWVVGFITHLPWVQAPAPAVGVGMLLVMLAGAALCARAVAPHAPVRTALLASLAGACINLLILGSVLTQDDGTQHPSAAVFVLGWFALCAVIGVVGGLVGARLPRSAPPTRVAARDWAAPFAIVCVASAVPVIFSGGLVTSHDAGLAVPDWPTSFNANMFLYPLAKMTGGIYYEHAHRLFGSLAGFSVLAFMVCAWAWKTPKRTRVCATIAFLIVLTQGIVGGVRVTGAIDRDDAGEVAAAQQTVDTVNPDAVTPDYALTTDNAGSKGSAIFHGVFGQITIAFLCATGAIATRRYAKDGTSDIVRTVDPVVRYGSMALMLALLLQLILGALSRHLESTHSAYTHLGFAFVVFALLAVVAMRAMKHGGTPLPRLGMVCAVLVIVQILLGFGALALVLPSYDGTPGADAPFTAFVATLHQATGAALLGACTLLHIWGMRCTTRAVRPLHEQEPE